MEPTERFMVMLDYPDGRHDYARDVDNSYLPWMTTSRAKADQSAAARQVDVGDTYTMRVVRQTDMRFSIGDDGALVVQFSGETLE